MKYLKEQIQFIPLKVRNKVRSIPPKVRDILLKVNNHIK